MSGRKQVQQCWSRRANLFDHLVGAREQGWRDSDAERLACLQINDQLECGWCLHREIGGFLALENAIDIARRTP